MHVFFLYFLFKALLVVDALLLSQVRHAVLSLFKAGERWFGFWTLVHPVTHLDLQSSL